VFCKTLKLLILILTISLISSCVKNSYAVRNTETAVINQAESEVIIKSVEFVFSSRKTNGKEFAKIEKWDVAKIADNQKSFDVVCEIENKGKSWSDFVVLTSGDFITAPRNKYSEADLDKLTEEVAWGYNLSMNDVKAQVLRHLKPYGTEKIIFENFNIGDVIK
jgi:Icc-related predicted phosphoesterase